jgi:hypothetical protein
LITTAEAVEGRSIVLLRHARQLKGEPLDNPRLVRAMSAFDAVDGSSTGTRVP